ncbi:MAG: GNAT family N-acetyltransferase [Lachnospiraceae bacterium]|nr:GNAT family N-acetyltransferase [Lachnospiraceae bacterium]MBR4413366.1 GNAT family N-acetyltransferase [Lachnospiraceae bacterium]MBR5066986.1 GNAT family N-acetyltransferase [Lachnospiraceae bacterium]MBR5916886.1 GNAT family N-acetyltransferase [Lachnospiraceae bacterium]
MTNEVTIRPITYDDTENIIKWRNSEYVNSRFIDRRLFTKESHEAWLKNFVETGKVAQFIILLDGEAVGSVYLRDIDPDTKEAEYGIFIGEESARGKGVGTKSAKLILKYAFEELGLKKIFLRVLKNNPGAVRSYEKAGFKKIDRVDTLTVDGETLEVIFMELEKKDFEKR